MLLFSSYRAWLDLSKKLFDITVRRVHWTKLGSEIHILGLVEMNIYYEKFQEDGSKVP